MDEQYDVVVLGTGLSECILSSLLSIEGKKVLHMDRNDYYGGECASLSLSQLFKKFRNGQAPPSEYGRDRDYNIDLVPKFMMAAGELVKILVYTDVTRYIEFQQISGSYVYRDGKINKVPATDMEALSSPLMGFFEKRRAQKFFQFISSYKDDNPSTYQGVNPRDTMLSCYQKFGLEPGTQDFIGHSLALYLNDEYLQKPIQETMARISLYFVSLSRFGKSPYIYPMYGLGELPQGFARLSAIYGGTYMLDKKCDGLIYDDQGRVCGVKSGDEVAKCKAVIGDPTYFPDKVKTAGKLIRTICLLKQPIPNTNDVDSLQLILPQRQLNRKYDIYVAVMSSTHQVCAKGYYVAIVSTMCETSVPEREIEPALALLGPIVEKFTSITDILEPKESGEKDQVFISKTFDATSHFETVCHDVKSLYQRFSGKPLDLSNPPKRPENQ